MEMRITIDLGDAVYLLERKNGSASGVFTGTDEPSEVLDAAGCLRVLRNVADDFSPVRDMNDPPWIAVDLDGTLAHHDQWDAWNKIGPVIPAMRDRVLAWVAEGKIVRIFTARVAYANDVCAVTGEALTRYDMVRVIQDWLEANGMPRLGVTHEKDLHMVEQWDDRAVQVIKNTGRTLAEEHEAEREALRGAP